MKPIATRLVPLLVIFAALTAAAPPAAAQRQQNRGAAAPAAQPAPPPAPTTLPNGFPWIETTAQFAYMVDVDTDTVMLDKNGDQRMFPSSMTKMMTSHIVFEKLERGDMKLTDMLPVSENAWRKGGARTGGSTMFLDLNSRASVEDLLKGVIIASGNDACIVLAEAISGSEEAFAEEMTKRAKQLGMTNTNFRNSTGWPDPDHYTTAKDLAILAEHTIRAFPQYYKMYADKEFVYNGIKQGNRNPLLYRNNGTDGLKTGHTEASGYGLTASAVRDGRRILLVINGLRSIRERGTEAEKLTEWGFREFANYALFKQGDTVERADVWLGTDKNVALVAPQPLMVTLPRKSRKDMKVTVSYLNPVQAPIRQGDRVAKLLVSAPSVEPVELPLVAGASVDRLGAMGRMSAAASYLLFGNGK